MAINPKKIIQISCYYILPILGFLMLINSFYNLSNSYELMVNFGNIAMYLVFALLIAKPLSILWPKVPLRKLMLYRRELGVLAFWYAVFHSFALMNYLEMFSFEEFFIILKPGQINLLFGVISLIGMIILGITSNKLSVIKLKKNWKKVQMIAYPTLIFIVLHSTYKDITKLDINNILNISNLINLFPLILLLAYFILKILEIKKQKTKIIHNTQHTKIQKN